MNPEDLNQPKSVNKDHFTSNLFPSVIAFCDRDETTHIVSGDEESYSYKLQNKTVYMLKKSSKDDSNRFEITEFDEGKARYELTSLPHHHHAICTKCRKVEDIKECNIREVKKNAENNLSFKIEFHRIELFGKCHECRSIY